ncbi:MAG: LexA family transcriptional regulator [Candidatus Pacebacteria bacterium]|nr:LexA family transcriptional regulator [Candidatus Paceibacterota bacterium]
MSYESYKKKITDFYKSHKRVPGYSEIMSLVGFKSKNAVYKLINKLVDDGIFEKDSKGKLTPARLHGDVPVLGLVEAGMPTVAGEEMLDATSIEDFLLGDSKDSTYMLEVKGESMIEAHIAEGDMVLVERRTNARVGDIVIAEVDGGWTMKYYRIDKRGNPYLQPANKKFKDIYPEYDLKIAAVVKAVIRKF